MSLRGSTILVHSEIENCFAKSDKTTIRQHNESLTQQLGLLKERTDIYGLEKLEEKFNILSLLNEAIKYHDYGKANNEFQNKVQKKEHKEKLLHHLLSPIFYLLDKNLNIEKEDKLVLYAIIHHHSRQLELLESLKCDINDDESKKLFGELLLEKKDTLIGIKQLNDEINGELYNAVINKFLNIVIRLQRLDKNRAVLLTGLLVRLDHAASGDLEVEEEPIREDRKTLLIKYFQGKGKFTGLKPFQEKFGINNKKDYQCIVADTGLGKTGLSVLWSSRKKFYILPNRASVNAMYRTLSEIYGEDKVGLLHSTALFNLIDQSENDDVLVVKDYEQARVLSKPVTVCTADQLFTAAFNMPGYEKIYATLAYSDVIIDEIQGFQPQQIVPILKQIRETKAIGTRYLIITATLPDIVAEELRNMDFEVVSDDCCTIDTVKRHKVKLKKSKIEDLIDDIYYKYQQNKKVLVVTNTVKKSQEVYRRLGNKFAEKDGNKEKLNLLHSRFIWKDRRDKERAILSECYQDDDGNYKNPVGCIWVTTQLVEASLDIDFDCLFTEAATADSLIQRMGRVWRHRKIDYVDEANIIIACNVENKIYEKDLTKKSIEIIQKKLNDGYLLSKDKREIVQTIYSKENLKDSKYIEEWRKFEDQINLGWQFILKESGQEAFRDVMTVELIPIDYEQKVNNLVYQLKTLNQKNYLAKNEKKVERIKILKQIQEYKVPIPIYWIHNNCIRWLDKSYYIGILQSDRYKYNKELGLILQEQICSTETNII